MSYLRFNQTGTYITIPTGSDYYLYDNGKHIAPYSYEEFAAMIGQVADEIDISDDEAIAIKAGFRAHFEGWDPEYTAAIDKRERAEIFCQCVDSRIESLVLTDELHEAVREWAEKKE